MEQLAGGLMAPRGQPSGQGEAVSVMQAASPEEQAEYDQFVGNGMKLIYSESTFPKILESLTSGDDAKHSLAQTAAMIVVRTVQSAMQAGRKLSGDVILHGGTELFEEVADVATKAGVHDFAKDRNALEGAMFQAMDMARQNLQGMGAMDPEAVRQDVDQLENMNESGELDSMLRELARNDPRQAGAATGQTREGA